jgi:nucleoside-diphosphate-sugar epimerase
MTNPTPTDWRALCAELLTVLDDYDPIGAIRRDDVITRARAALAQPEPQGPTVMKIIELHTWLEDEWRVNNDGEDLPMVDFARAVLARWGCPAIEPVPSSEEN